ncbi:MAG: M23 family metallopeptidase [Candidatus Methylomirabilales bacterium]
MDVRHRGPEQRATEVTRRLAGLSLGLFLLATLPAWGAGFQVHVPKGPVVQGDLRLLPVTTPEPLLRLDARFRGLSLPARPRGREYTVLLAVDLATAPGRYPFVVEARGVSGRRYRRRVRLTVADGRFPVQRLTLPKGMVELDAATLDRVHREQAVLTAIWKKWTAGPYRWDAFVLPLDGAPRVSSQFGLRRIINGQPRSPHSGLDFAASSGTPVRASNRGVVVYAGAMFFSGNSVILHHGGGLFTMYFHLQGYRVTPGQEVAKGATLGWVGATGRATGPHLHWGARLHGARFDPRRLLQLSLP